MDAYKFPVEETRALLQSTLPAATSTGASDEVPARFLYVPERHARALQKDVALILGIRGAGKTLWWKVLQDGGLRQRLSSRMEPLRFLRDARVVGCFGAGGGSALYPSGRIVSHLLEQGHDPEDIWRTIVLCNVIPETFSHATDWSTRVAWVATEEEQCERLLHRVDGELETSQRDLLLIFDGLDRAGRAWSDVRKMLRGLLQLLVGLRELKKIRGKAFVRPEMLDNPQITSFQDASKLLNAAVDLEWRPPDLYGLLWQYLGNATNGEAFRNGTSQGFGVRWDEVDGGWSVPEPMRSDPVLQEQVLTSIAGKYMGDPRRGRVYTWLPNHLGDAQRQISPRSFLVAVRHAADMSSQTATALDHRAIREGVVRASRVRRHEIQEDQPWVGEALAPLANLLVPALEQTVLEAWKKARLIERLHGSASDDGRSIPRYIDDGLIGIMRELQEIGVLDRSPDGYIQMPEFYRIAFGIGRRGGVPPVRR